jgi:predicted ribosome quality control (RQC) complex YloA/Tae2 family protein
MKYTLTALDLHFLIIELQDLINAKIDKIYQPVKEDFLFIFHVPGKGKKILRITLPNQMFITDFKGETPQTPLHFCMMLRKYLSNSRLRKIRQLGFERIVEFVFEKKDGKMKLFVELFSAGNVILCDDKEVIKSALITKKWKDRTIRGNIPYEYPKRDHDILKIDEKGFFDVIKNSNKESIVKSLALDFGLGGKYSEELCLRTGVDKEKVKVDDSEIKKLFSEVEKLSKEKVNAVIILKENEPFDVVPIQMKSYEGLEVNQFNTYSEALGEILTVKVIEEQTKKAQAGHNKELKRMEKIVSGQDETIKKLKKTVVDNQKKGEMIFEKYEAINEILIQVNKARKKYSFKEIKKKLKGHEVIKEVNEKNKEIVVDI